MRREEDFNMAVAAAALAKAFICFSHPSLGFFFLLGAH